VTFGGSAPRRRPTLHFWVLRLYLSLKGGFSMRGKQRFVFCFAVGVIALSAVVFSTLSQDVAAGSNGNSLAARAILRNATGGQVGRATFVQTAGAVTVRVSSEGLPAEFHGFHVHQVGKCDAPDFVSAGGHFNLTGETHGGHAGDLPSLLVNKSGTGRATFVTDRFRVSDLLAGQGTALIIHANRDNFANIPTRYAPAPDATTLATGDAGARIACGVIQPFSGPIEGID
jgi:Cu-Zn family superoxide dismutase